MRVAWILACSCLLTATTAAQDAPEPSASTPAAASAPKLLLLPAFVHGIDPAVAPFVDRGLQRGAEQRGYARVPDASAGAQTAVPAGTAVVPSMVELWQRMHLGAADYAVVALVSARDGQYSLELRVACRDGSGPFYAHGQASNVELEQAAALLLAQVLPQPAVAPIAAAVPSPSPSPTPSPNPSATPIPIQSPTPPPQPAPASGVNPYRNAIPNPNPYRGQMRAREPHPQRDHDPHRNPYRGPSSSAGSWSDRVRVTAHDELVLGVDRDDFVGVLLGVRADYHIGPALFVGGYGGYANLPGRETRAHSLLTYAQLEHRIQVNETIGVPSRLGLGYLARNGAVLRLGSGVALRITEQLELVLDLLTPMFWVTPDTTVFSLNFGIELGTRL